MDAEKIRVTHDDTRECTSGFKVDAKWVDTALDDIIEEDMKSIIVPPKLIELRDYLRFKGNSRREDGDMRLWEYKKKIGDDMEGTNVGTENVGTTNIKEKHGVPALSSVFIPGLGQLIKGQVCKGIVIFIGMGISLFLCLTGIGFITSPILWLWNMVQNR